MLRSSRLDPSSFRRRCKAECSAFAMHPWRPKLAVSTPAGQSSPGSPTSFAPCASSSSYVCRQISVPAVCTSSFTWPCVAIRTYVALACRDRVFCLQSCVCFGCLGSTINLSSYGSSAATIGVQGLRLCFACYSAAPAQRCFQSWSGALRLPPRRTISRFAI